MFAVHFLTLLLFRSGKWSEPSVLGMGIAVPVIKYYVIKMYEASSYGIWEAVEMHTGQETG
jgi:hypothetical protein